MYAGGYWVAPEGQFTGGNSPGAIHRGQFTGGQFTGGQFCGGGGGGAILLEPVYIPYGIQRIFVKFFAVSFYLSLFSFVLGGGLLYNLVKDGMGFFVLGGFARWVCLVFFVCTPFPVSCMDILNVNKDFSDTMPF